MTFFLQFLQAISLAVWLGAIVFFSFFVAPSAFAALPTRQLAGTVVSLVLTRLHQLGIIMGLMYLGCGVVLTVVAPGTSRLLSLRHLFVVLMLVLTCTSQWVISARMAALRSEMGNIDAIPTENPVRVEFNRWHQRSVWLETGTLLLGLAALFAQLKRS
jgi:putative copper export protein